LRKYEYKQPLKKHVFVLLLSKNDDGDENKQISGKSSRKRKSSEKSGDSLQTRIRALLFVFPSIYRSNRWRLELRKQWSFEPPTNYVGTSNRSESTTTGTHGAVFELSTNAQILSEMDFL